MSKSLAEAGAGRGTVGKPPVTDAKDRATNQVAAKVVPSTANPVLHAFVDSHVANAAVVYTNGTSVYDDFPTPHEAVNHNLMEYVLDDVYTNGVESFRSMLKLGQQDEPQALGPLRAGACRPPRHPQHGHAQTDGHRSAYIRRFGTTAYLRPYRTERSFIGSSIMNQTDRMDGQAIPTDPVRGRAFLLPGQGSPYSEHHAGTTRSDAATQRPSPTPGEQAAPRELTLYIRGSRLRRSLTCPTSSSGQGRKWRASHRQAGHFPFL